MQRIKKSRRTRSVCPKGQSLAEYGLVLALVATVAISSLSMLGGSIQNQLSGLASSIGQVATSSGGLAIAAAPSSGGTAPATTGSSSIPTGTSATPPLLSSSSSMLPTNTRVSSMPASDSTAPADTSTSSGYDNLPASTPYPAPATTATAQSGCSGYDAGCMSQGSYNW